MSSSKLKIIHLVKIIINKYLISIDNHHIEEYSIANWVSHANKLINYLLMKIKVYLTTIHSVVKLETNKKQKEKVVHLTWIIFLIMWLLVKMKLIK
jgi:hypothetical protein